MIRSHSEKLFFKSHQHRLCHLLDMLKALNFDDPEARHMQLTCSIWIDLDVQLFSVLTQQVSEKQKETIT